MREISDDEKLNFCSAENSSKNEKKSLKQIPFDNNANFSNIDEILNLQKQLRVETDLMKILPWEKLWHLKNFFLKKKVPDIAKHPPEYLHELRYIAKMVLAKTEFIEQPEL